MEAELLAATRGIAATVPVTPVVRSTGFGPLLAETQAATIATEQMAAAQIAGANASRIAAREAAAHTRTLGNLERAATANTASLIGLRGAVLTAGTAFLGATVAIQAAIRAIGSAAELERQLNVFRVTAGATADEMARVSATAKQLGSDITLPAVSAGDAAEAMTELAKAGLSVRDSLDAARGVLQLATAAQVDNVTATTLVASALNAFSLNGREAVRVADLLAGAANESQGSLLDMGIALRQSAGAASQIGLSVEDTVVLLTALARAGLAGSDAGTTLRVALLRLVAPTKDAQTALERFNVQLRDTEGNVRVEALFELEKALQGVSKAQADAARVAIFGQNAFRVSALLGREGASGFQELSDAVTEAGLAAELAGAQTQGFSGDIEALKNSADALGIELGQVATGPLGFFIRSLADSATALTDVVRAAKDAGGAISDFGKDLAGVVPFANQAESAISKIVSTAIKVQFLGGALTAASFALDKFGASAKDAASDSSVFDAIVSNVSSSLEDLIHTLDRLRAAAIAQQPGDEGLGVQQILNRVTGFDSAETRARIRGDTEELLSVLQSEQSFLEAQLERDFVKRRPALQHRLEDALLGTVNDIASITQQGAAATKKAAAEAARAQREADQALLDLLSNRREDADRRAAEAATTEGLTDDIRAQDRIQALIKQQIQKVRDRIKDEKTRRAAIRDLRIALIASRQEEERLRKEQLQQAAENKQTSIQLDIDLAVTTENTNREIAARRRLIALLKKQQAQVKKGTIEWKRLRNEIAEQQKAIEEAQKQADSGEDARKKAAQFFFEQLQAQQGFASNLLGNLIPRDQTAGLVSETAGVSTTDVGGRITVEAAAARGRASGGPTAGQVNSTNDLLLKILNQLKHLNGLEDAPEAKHQRRVGRAALDYHH